MSVVQRCPFVNTVTPLLLAAVAAIGSCALDSAFVVRAAIVQSLKHGMLRRDWHSKVLGRLDC